MKNAYSVRFATRRRALTAALLFGLGAGHSTLAFATETKPVDITPWQKAKIDWRQLAGANISVIGDSQSGFRSLTPLLPAFEALTGIKVGMVFIPQEEMRKKLRTDLSSHGGVFDVVPMGITDLGEAHHAGWLEPLDPFTKDRVLTDPAWFDMDDFSQRVLSLCGVGGQTLTLPFDFSAPIFFYRKDLFEKYQIAVPDTYEELVVMKKKLQTAMDADGVKGVSAFVNRTTVGAGDNTWTIIPAIRSYGGEMFDKQWKPIFNSPQAIQALTLYRDSVTGYGNPVDTLTQPFVAQRKMFRDGKVASGIFASHIFGYLNDPQSSVAGKWDAALPPKGSAGRFTSPWAWGFGINALAKIKKQPGFLCNGRLRRKPPCYSAQGLVLRDALSGLQNTLQSKRHPVCPKPTTGFLTVERTPPFSWAYLSSLKLDS